MSYNILSWGKKLTPEEEQAAAAAAAEKQAASAKEQERKQRLLEQAEARKKGPPFPSLQLARAAAGSDSPQPCHTCSFSNLQCNWPAAGRIACDPCAAEGEICNVGDVGKSDIRPACVIEH